MSLRRTQPLAFRPHGLSDALDSSQVFSGAMTALQDLIPDPSTKGLWQCRPAATLLGVSAGTLGGFSSGFSSGFQIGIPNGAVSCMLVVGSTVYGMATQAAGTQDFPFAFNLLTNTFVPLTGVSSAVLPTAQPTSGDWTPPTMDVIGSTILITHPGFAGTANWIAWIDTSTPTAPVWHAGNITGAGGFSFSATTGVPVAVKAFNGRAYWAFNPPAGPSATVFSDVLAPTTVTNAGSVQIITYDDNTPITALGALPLSNQLGGVIQSLMVFKGVSNIYQITGDIALGSGPPLGTLQKNSLNVATGTFAPNSIAATPKGLAFVAPDGVRVIDFDAKISDPIGNDGNGKTVPFIYAVSPSRIAAAANGTVYRVNVQDGYLPGSPQKEYWLDFSRGGVWSGPHSFPARLIKPYRDTFITAPYAVTAALFRSDYRQSPSSTFIENGLPMTVNWLTSMLPDTDQMCQNAMIESTIYIGTAGGSSYSVQAFDEESNVLSMVTLANLGAPVLWGSFTWGQADWGGSPSALFPQRLAWPIPVVFRRLAIGVSGPASQQLRIGTLHLKYEMLGYLQQPSRSATQQPVVPPAPTFPPPSGPVSSAGIFAVPTGGTSRSVTLGPLVRTLWSAQLNDPRVAYNPATLWDGKLDDGTIAPSGDYIIALLTHNVSYTWEGAVGNSSPDHSNVSVSRPPDLAGSGAGYFSYYHSYGGNINDMVIDASGNMFFVTGYDERLNTMHVTTTSNPQYTKPLFLQGFRGTYSDELNCCTDGNILYLHYWDGGSGNGVNGIDISTIPVPDFIHFSATGGAIGVGTNQFILGLAVQQTGNLLFIARVEIYPTNSIWVLNKTTGVLLYKNLLGYAVQGRVVVNPVDDSLWVAHHNLSPTTDATWDAYIASIEDIILSNGNLTAFNPITSAHFITSTGSGTKFYFEIVQDISGGISYDMPIGVSDVLGFTNNLGDSIHSVGFYGNGSVNFNAGAGFVLGYPVYGPGDNISIAVDIPNSLIWIRVNGGAWNLGGTANPATGVGGYSIAGIGSPVYAIIGFTQTHGQQATAHFKSSSWTYAAPAGFIQLPGVIRTPVITQLTANPSTGVLTETGVHTAGTLAEPAAMAVSLDGSTLLVVDGGASQQIKAFNTSDGSVKTAWGNSGTLGDAGGYANGPAVSNTRYMFASFAGFSGSQGWITYAPDGSFWFGDAGNCRYLHFSAGNSPAYIEQISYMPGFYATWVCYNDPTRVFATYLEFKIDYSKPLAPGNGSWTLVNNWFYGLPGVFEQYYAMRYTITASNGRTYVPVGGVIYELTSTGYRNTGVHVLYNYIDAQFNLWIISGPYLPGQQAAYYKNAFVGFDASNNPIWTTDPSSPSPTPFLITQTLPTRFPNVDSADNFNNTSNSVETLSNGVIPVYDPSGTNGNHFGGVDVATGLIKFSAHPSIPSNNGGENTFLNYPPVPYFCHPQGGSGVINPGGFQTFVPGTSDVFTLYRGESWGSNQTTFWSHWHESGLLVNRTGVAAPYFGNFTSTLEPSSLNPGNLAYWDSFPYPALASVPEPSGIYGYMGTKGLSGNSAWGGIAFQNGSYYLYHGDEWYHGGVHRWRISNLDTIKISSLPISWNASTPPPAPDPYDFLAGLPFNTTNIAASGPVGGWARTGGPDVGPAPPATPADPGYRVYTNAITCDPHASPDLVFECSGIDGSMTYSWTRVGSGSWTISGTLVWLGESGLFGGVFHGIAIDILDSSGKIIVRMWNGESSDTPGSDENCYINDHHPMGPLLRGPNGVWQTWVKQPQPLQIHYDHTSGKIAVTYAGFSISGITVYDAGADIAHPAKFRLSSLGAVRVNACFMALRFSDV